MLSRAFLNNPGDFLLSHAVTRAVPSAPAGLTSVFGMGTGVTCRQNHRKSCETTFDLCSLYFDLCSLPHDESLYGRRAKNKVQSTKFKRDLRESNSGVAFTKASSRKREFVA